MRGLRVPLCALVACWAASAFVVLQVVVRVFVRDSGWGRRLAMARKRTWTAAAAGAERERTGQVARLGSNLNQLARCANRHASAVEAVEE